MKDGRYEKAKYSQGKKENANSGRDTGVAKNNSTGKKRSLTDMVKDLEEKSINWTEEDWKNEMQRKNKSISTDKASNKENGPQNRKASTGDGKGYASKNNARNDKNRDTRRSYSSQKSQDSGMRRDRLGKEFDPKEGKFGNDKRNNQDRAQNSGGKIDNNRRGGRREDNSACKHMRDCGSCNVLEETYLEHLARKQKMVEKLLNKFGKVEPILGMKDPFHYRNKVHVVFDHDRRGNPISGLYEENSHRVIPIEKCKIHNEKADEIINSIRGMLKSFKIKTFDEDSGFGLIRHVVIRSGFNTNEIMVVLVLSSPILPSKNNFIKALRKEHPEITTIILNVNDKKTSMVLGEKEHVIYGKGYIEDVLCDKVFHISAKSFYQVNPAQTEVLYSKAIEFAQLDGTETIIDAYCGIGTIGFIASDKVKRVIGVELNRDAVKDAIVNMKRNKISNAEIYNKDAGEFMRQAAEAEDTKIDVVFMDPPRAGSDETFLSSVETLNPEKVVYISCNPVTLERDLQFITKKGYKVKKIQPVDMFPWTEHVETVTCLHRVNS